MLHRLSIFCLFLGLFITGIHAQNGKLAGKVLDQDGNPLSFASVFVYSGETFKHGAISDETGFFSIQPIAPGTYRVEAKFQGGSATINDVPIKANQTRNVELKFSQGYTIETVTIYEEGPFEKSPIVGTSLNNTDVNNAGTRNVNTLAALTAGVFQADEGGALSIRGARSSSTVYYVDGVKIRGRNPIPQASIAELQVITGGTPAEFGDFTGGVINITTANPASTFSGGVELVTSQFLDAYNRNLAALTLSGPLITKTKTIDGSEYKSSLLGFFINGEVIYDGDQSPAALGIFELRDGLLDSLRQNPLRISEDNLSFRSNGNYIRESDVRQVAAKTNNTSLTARGLVRLDFQPTDNILVKVGGNYEFLRTDRWSLSNMLFAPDPNSIFEGQTYRGYVRFQQNFQGKKNSTIRNLFYTLQADFSRYNRFFINGQFRDNYFDYGYVGSFDFDLEPNYVLANAGYDPNDPISSAPYWISNGFRPQNLRFNDEETRLPYHANHNNLIFDYVANNGITNIPGLTGNFTDASVFNISSLNELSFRQGILNGGGPRSVYSLFTGIGAQSGGYTKFEFDQARIIGQATAEIKAHNLKVGFEFEQRTERFWGLSASSLWPLMRQLANFHILNLEDDPSKFTYTTNNSGVWNDSVLVPRRFSASDQTEFDKRLRTQILGLAENSLDFINTDALRPEQLSLDLFTADELLNDGTFQVVNYYGYNFKGERQARVNPNNIFSDSTNRPQNAFAPTYISAFIQDQFEFEDIIFNVGLRVDRFDANQLVLNDPFSLSPFYTAGEVATGQIGNIEQFSLPTGIGADFVPYVNSEDNFDQIIGYRNGESWFDANGTPISSQEIARLSPGGRPIPALQPTVDNEGNAIDAVVTQESFRDYVPQITPMPRISFSFPISDQALFFAHYDVLAQRPGQISNTSSSLVAGQLLDYLFLANRPTVEVNNPNLRPEITIDYEAGFKQRIGEKVGLTLSAFYREQRNMIRFRRYNNAYPFSYDTYDNLDFGTIKGFAFIFDMRRTRNVQLRAAYTLQFADATGSSFSSARSVVNFLEGVGILRAPQPINTDQRHRISVNLDYRFLRRAFGPGFTIGENTFYPLKNAGINFIGQIGSGTPYSKNTVPTPTVQSGVATVSQLLGSPNGARKPWTFRLDIRADKTFNFGGKRKADGTQSREYNMNVYITMLNALNTLNILNVYRFTGLPDDDGYLQSDLGQQAILNQIDPVSFVDLYNVRLQNPGNYSLPRRIRLGLMFNF
ncbi:MAG: TonB-dependent receptor [Bacteroidia bacterium]|nr:TonB-dependent receptor [Bacteroidia bacterium]